MSQPNVVKSAGIIIQNRKVLLTRAAGKNYFISPGGRVETGESFKEALIRELWEEVSLKVDESDLEFFGSFSAPAAGHEEVIVEIHTFLVNKWEGEPKANNVDETIEEIIWIDSNYPKDLKIGSIFEHDVIPKLKEQNLID